MQKEYNKTMVEIDSEGRNEECDIISTEMESDTQLPTRPSGQVSTNSLIMDVVACIDIVARARTTVDSESEAGEALHSVHTNLCALMQSMLSSPLTGRMFAPMPAAIIPYEVQRQSLYEQTRM